MRAAARWIVAIKRLQLFSKGQQINTNRMEAS
jgi:hypothetical protein